MQIRILREAAGLTREQVALRMGVSLYVVEQWETETALPRARELPLLAWVLGCSVNDLYNSDEKEDHYAEIER